MRLTSGAFARRLCIAARVAMCIAATAALCACDGNSSPNSTDAAAASAPQPPRPAPMNELDSDRLMQTLRELPTRRAAAGTQEDRDGLLATESLVERTLAKLGYTPAVETFYWTAIPGLATTGAEPDGRPTLDPSRAQPIEITKDTRPEMGAIGPWHNYVVEITGSEKPDEVILIGAHFDAYINAPGADDNATGTAALLEIARVLQGREFKRTVRLAFFNLEEVGLVGSRHHAAKWREANNAKNAGAHKDDIVLMLSLEMLGYFTDEPNSQKSPIPPIKGVFEPPTVGDFIGLATTQKHAGVLNAFDASLRRAQPTLKTFSTSVFPDVDGDKPLMIERTILRSDHAAFLLVGEPGIIVTDTSNFRNPHYHTPGDTVETIDQERFTLVTRALIGSIEELANADEVVPAVGPAPDSK
jgi:hypothetical protein